MQLFPMPRPAAAARAASLALLLAAAPAASRAESAAAPTGPKITEFTLENGLEALVIEDRRAPVVTHMVWYRVGAADEPRGQSGIAHFLEHLMFKGTDDVPSGEFSKIVAANGGQDNAFTSADYTGYFQRIASDRLDLVMRLEADRMRDLRLTEEDVATERAVVLEERSSRTDNDPQGKFYEQLSAALYMNHPYGVPVIGWRHEIEALDRETALAFYERFYAPNNAILVVAGDVDPAEVERLARLHYGPLAPTDARAEPRASEPPQLAERRVLMQDPKVRQPFLTRAYLAPSYATAAPGEAEALALAAEIVGGGLTSRLSKALVLEEKIALNAGAWYRGVARDVTSFNLYAVPADGVELSDLEARMNAVLAAFVADGPTEEELERAKTGMIASSIYAQDSQAAMAQMYGAALTSGLTVADVTEWPERIRAVTAEQVRAAAASLRREASVTGYLTQSADGAEEVVR